jgi:hypothetical protein
MFRRITELDATHVLAGAFRLKCLLERPDRVRVQVIANKGDPTGTEHGIEAGFRTFNAVKTALDHSLGH